MATAKKTAKKKKTTRRAPAKRKTASRRRTVARAGFGVTPMNLGLAIAGAMLADAYAEKIPIKDEKMRNGALCIGAAFLALKGPAELRPLFVGASIVGGVKTAAIMFPKLLPAPSSNGTATVKRMSATSRTIGRLTEGEENTVRDAVVYRMEREGMGIHGAGTSFSPVTGRSSDRFSPVTGRAHRRIFSR